MRISVEAISKRFGGLQALQDISLVARSGEVTAVIGPNGAGKSTLINCLSGVTAFDTGRVVINDAVHAKIARESLIDAGITRTFQNSRLWNRLSVIEHVALAAHNFCRSARGRRMSIGSVRDTAERNLARVGLTGKENMQPGDLSYGERRRLEIARCLAISPQLLLLDEPVAGSTPSEQGIIAALILEITTEGCAIILVEHHMAFVGQVAKQVVVMNFGRVMATGTLDEVRSDRAVVAAYLGSEG